MEILNAPQGSPEWHAHRANHFNASDAPAMMGCSPYKTRTQLLAELSTGVMPEVSPETQRLFDNGHRYEALARPLAEEIIGKELYPVVGSEGKYSASFDGITMLEDIAFEHKSLNDELRAAMVEGCTGADLPLLYRVQMEQQCMVSGAQQVLFMASKWAGDQLIESRHCWYTPDPELRARIVAGWEQFDADLCAFVPDSKPAALVAPVEVVSLPAVTVRVDGALAVTSNLEPFGARLREFISGLPKAPTSDEEFAQAEAGVKTLEKAEDAIKSAVESAVAQTASLEAVVNLGGQLRELARTTRLQLDKVVKARKDQVRSEIVREAQAQLDEHITALNKRLGANWLPRVIGGFTEAVKGKKTVASCKDAVSVALANAKIEASAMADRLQLNRQHLMQADADWIFLFADFASVGGQAAEYFQAVAAQRIEKHKKAEADRLEAERERIRMEERARAEREAAAELERQRKEMEAARQRANSPAEQAATNGKADNPEPGKLEAAQPQPTGPADEACRPVTAKETAQRATESADIVETRETDIGGGDDAKHAGDLRGPADDIGRSIETSEDEAVPLTAEQLRALSAPRVIVAEPDESDVADVLREALEFTKYAAAAFAGKFPTQPKPGPEWWAALRYRIERLQPMLKQALGEA
jgi:putative phage-type endonuclease